jgi:hypothetical protein
MYVGTGVNSSKKNARNQTVSDLMGSREGLGGTPKVTFNTRDNPKLTTDIIFKMTPCTAISRCVSALISEGHL